MLQVRDVDDLWTAHWSTASGSGTQTCQAGVPVPPAPAYWGPPVPSPYTQRAVILPAGCTGGVGGVIHSSGEKGLVQSMNV